MPSASRRSKVRYASSVFERPMIVKSGNTKKRKLLTDKDGEVRELQAADIRAMKPLDHFPELAKLIRGRGQRGPQKAPTKQQVTLRLDRDVVERFRSTGAGWQKRINEALRKAQVG